MKKTLLIGLPLALVLLAVGFYQAIYVAPTEATMGEIQRIFYYHFPSAIMALLFPYVNFIASLVFISTRNSNPQRAQAADALALAAAEMTLVFCTSASPPACCGHDPCGASGGHGTNGSPASSCCG